MPEFLSISDLHTLIQLRADRLRQSQIISSRGMIPQQGLEQPITGLLNAVKKWKPDELPGGKGLGTKSYGMPRLKDIGGL